MLFLTKGLCLTLIGVGVALSTGQATESLKLPLLALGGLPGADPLTLSSGGAHLPAEPVDLKHHKSAVEAVKDMTNRLFGGKTPKERESYAIAIAHLVADGEVKTDSYKEKVSHHITTQKFEFVPNIKDPKILSPFYVGLLAAGCASNGFNLSGIINASKATPPGIAIHKKVASWLIEHGSKCHNQAEITKDTGNNNLPVDAGTITTAFPALKGRVVDNIDNLTKTIGQVVK